jgi:hypothetical protein
MPAVAAIAFSPDRRGTTLKFGFCLVSSWSDSAQQVVHAEWWEFCRLSAAITLMPQGRPPPNLQHGKFGRFEACIAHACSGSRPQGDLASEGFMEI